MNIMVSCRCCHRVERWTPSKVVQTPGGSRIPEDPTWQAMDTLVASARGQLGPVVAVCEGCSQPMVASGPCQALRWNLPTLQGDLTYDERGQFHAGGRVLSVDEALSWLQVMLPRRVEPDERRMSWFEGALLLSMMAPLVLWVGTAMFVALFLYRFEMPGAP